MDWAQEALLILLLNEVSPFLQISKDKVSLILITVGMKLKSGELNDIVCIPTSERTREQAENLGIPLVTLNEKSRLDVAIDGADDVDPDLCLVKGGGGALLREKMVEVVADKFICIVDESKLSKGLGPGFPLPVEITPFCYEHTRKLIEGLPSVKVSER